MNINIIPDDNEFTYQILVTNISWNQNSAKSYRTKKDMNQDLPVQLVLDLPQNVLDNANKNKDMFNDIVESFVYNFMYRKFNHEVYRCQIWLPLDNNSAL